MGKRKRERNPQTSNSKARKQQECRLLSLPAEIRNMIWEGVVGSDPVLMCAKTYIKGDDTQIDSLTSFSLDPTYPEWTCAACHFPKEPNPPARRNKNAHAKGPLSWLRANRQIYNEARPIVQANFRLHICDSRVFSYFLSKRSRSIIRPQTLRYLSLCIGVMVEPYAPGTPLELHGASHPVCRERRPRPLCPCEECRVLKLTNKLSSLRELRLNISFGCGFGLEATRLRIFDSPDIPSHHGELSHLIRPLPWVIRMRQPRGTDPLVDDLCNKMPLLTFSREKKQVKSLDVRFAPEETKISSKDWCGGAAECWVHGRSQEWGVGKILFSTNEDIAQALEERLLK